MKRVINAAQSNIDYESLQSIASHIKEACDTIEMLDESSYNKLLEAIGDKLINKLFDSIDEMRIRFF